MATDNDVELQPILTSRKGSLPHQPGGGPHGQGIQRVMQTKSAYRTVLKASTLIFIWWHLTPWPLLNCFHSAILMCLIWSTLAFLGAELPFSAQVFSQYSPQHVE